MIKHLTGRTKSELFLRTLPKYIIRAILTSPFAIFMVAISSVSLAIAMVIFPLIQLGVWAFDTRGEKDWSEWFFPYWRFGLGPFCWYLMTVWKVEMEDLDLESDLNLD